MNSRTSFLIGSHARWRRPPSHAEVAMPERRHLAPRKCQVLRTRGPTGLDAATLSSWLRRVNPVLADDEHFRARPVTLRAGLGWLRRPAAARRDHCFGG